MYKWRLNLIAIVLLAGLCLLQYRLWFEGGGVRDMLSFKKTLSLQHKEIDKLKKRNEELVFQIQRLQNNHDSAELHARNELGMIKKDEKFYQIVGEQK